MTEIRTGVRVRSLRDTVLGAEEHEGYLGRLGTVSRTTWLLPDAVGVSWDGDMDGPWWWPVDDLEIVEGDEG